MELNWFREAGVTVIVRTAQSRKKRVLSDVYSTGPCVPSFYHRAINVHIPLGKSKCPRRDINNLGGVEEMEAPYQCAPLKVWHVLVWKCLTRPKSTIKAFPWLAFFSVWWQGRKRVLASCSICLPPSNIQYQERRALQIVGEPSRILGWPKHSQHVRVSVKNFGIFILSHSKTQATAPGGRAKEEPKKQPLADFLLDTFISWSFPCGGASQVFSSSKDV